MQPTYVYIHTYMIDLLQAYMIDISRRQESGQARVWAGDGYGLWGLGKACGRNGYGLREKWGGMDRDCGGIGKEWLGDAMDREG